MAEEELEENVVAVVRRRRGGRALLLALIGVVALLLLALWLARKPIAADLIDRELAKRGVPARYEVKRIGVRTQRLEGVRIGDPRRPDLTAEWVEVDLRPTFGAPEVRAIRAGGVRLRGRLVDGRLTLGAVDRLLPGPTGAAFRLPDLQVALRDARLALATEAGELSVRLDGAGNLAEDFSGRYAIAAPALDLGGCRVTDPRLNGRVTTSAARPRLVGPFSAALLDCGGARTSGLSGALDATLSPGLDGWRGQAKLASNGVYAADWSMIGARGQLDFAGDQARTAGALSLAGLGVAGALGRAARVELAGRYVVEAARAERLGDAAPAAASVRFEGGLSAADLTLAGAPRLDGFAQSVAGTPLEPLAAALARAGAAFGQDGDLRASLILATQGEQGSLRIANAALSGGGARLSFGGGEGLRLVWPGAGAVQLDGRLALSGAGVPQITAELRQGAPGAPVSGIARIAPFAADGSRVALSPVRFEGDRFSTVLQASGPLFGGRIEGARLPLSGRIGPGGLRLNTGCAPLSFERLAISGLDLQPARLRLCPAGPALVANGRFAGVIESPGLQGRLGSSPIRLAADRARFDGAGFRIADLQVRLGQDGAVSRLDIDTLTGAPGRGLSGRFAGASGQVARVPLMMSGASGQWRFAESVLTVSGGLTLSDEADPARFEPLVSRDFALRIAGNALTARGDLLAPENGALVTSVALRHDLSTGNGGADLDVPGLRFALDGLQPEAVTRLTLGVIANVDATVSGAGRIAWTGDGVTSSGDFRIRAASLAAPFGPVTGLATDIRFTDLLGLVTAPDQRATVETVNPGIVVEDGVVTYRLLAGLRVAIAGARWPFAGGELTLRPTTLDFSEEAARNLTFDITGLDAAKFINKLEFKNINASGVFDGTLPMVFDRDGGRIVDGSLASRPPGGTLSYVGEVSNADLGIWGGIAFDALKAIQYQNMTIGLNGDLDGEMVSEIRFNGVSRGTIDPVATGLIGRIGGQLASELQRLPFIFNIRIRAPFRGLISTARSFTDPADLIESQLGPGFEADPSVQPPVSENKP